MLLREFSVVKTLVEGHDWTGGRVIAAGSVGTIVDVHSAPVPGYEVEFLDEEGYTWALGTYHQYELEVVEHGA
jgi:hypothetical protein